jgi:CRP-like cAMP-binding protein
MNRNYLLELLPKNIQKILLSKARLIELNLSRIICVVDRPIDSIYFPVDGFISITQSLDDHPPIEVGMVGREGVLCAESALGVINNPFGALVQGSGSAWEITVEDFLAILKNSSELRILMNNYLAVRLSQLGLSAACEHFHEIGPRLAKWLLMSQDRAQSPTFSMTHEFISLMLGVRRVGVTTTAADFRRRGLIEYHRGQMKVLNRTALKSAACSCYEKNRKIYAAIIGQAD